MTDRDLKRLNRTELLEVILLLQKKEQELLTENQDLREQTQSLKEKLNARQWMLNVILGSMALETDETFSSLKEAVHRYRADLEKLQPFAPEEDPSE